MRLDRMLALAVTAMVMAAVVAASHAPLRPHPPQGALLRLAWSASPERVEDCRTRSAEELARLPPHMRQAVECEGVAASYRLTAAHGGRIVAERVVSAGGWRRDRRLYVFEEIPIPSGEALFEVRFERIEPQPASSTVMRDASGQAGRHETVPPRLHFSERRGVAAYSVLLISYDSGQRALVARAGSAAPD